MPPVVILGMHRSGTSLLSQIFVEAGIKMGKSFIPADKNNPNGYWEDEDFLGINKGLLEAAGGSWENPPTLISLYRKLPKFVNNLEKTVNRKEKLSRGELWGWKDPRTCITVPIFHRYLKNPKYIVIERNYEDVCRSLQRLHGGSEGKWIDLYMIYHQRIKDFILNNNPLYMKISYDIMVMDSALAKTTLTSIAYFINMNPTKLIPAERFITYKKSLQR